MRGVLLYYERKKTGSQPYPYSHIRGWNGGNTFPHPQSYAYKGGVKPAFTCNRTFGVYSSYGRRGQGLFRSIDSAFGGEGSNQQYRKVILQDHIEHCIVDAVESGDKEALDELNKAIDRFIK